MIGTLIVIAVVGYVLFGPPPKTQDQLDEEWRQKRRNVNPPYRGQERPPPPSGSNGRGSL